MAREIAKRPSAAMRCPVSQVQAMDWAVVADIPEHATKRKEIRSTRRPHARTSSSQLKRINGPFSASVKMYKHT